MARIYYTELGVQLSSMGDEEVVAWCEPGDFATGGGFDIQFSPNTKIIRSQQVQEQGPGPAGQGFGQGWVVRYNGPFGSAVWTKAVCLDVTP